MSAKLPMAAPAATTLTLGADCAVWIPGSKVGILPSERVDEAAEIEGPSGDNDEFVKGVPIPEDVNDAEPDREDEDADADDADGFKELPAEGGVEMTSRTAVVI